MAKTRVGVLGCGNVSEYAYLPDLAASPYVELVAVSDVDADRAQRAAAQHAIPRWYDDPRTMLARADAELIVNLTPMPMHAPLNRLALEAGHHVLCEKPLATSLRDADDLVNEAARRGLTLCAAPNAVLSPTFAAAAGAIATGEIGRVYAARGRYGHSGPHAAWYYGPGGGSLFDLGVYNVVTLTGLLGPARGVVALSGITAPTRVLDGEDVRVEADDNTMLLLDFGDAVYASIATGFIYPSEHDGRSLYDDRATIDLCGTRGALNWLGYDWEPRGIEVRTSCDEGWQTRATDQQGYTWQCGGSYLARCLAEGTAEPLMSAEHAYHTLEVMLGALESARSGRRIEIQSTFPWPLLD